jgi:hypothetical protein
MHWNFNINIYIIMKAEISSEEKEHYALVMFNKSYDLLSREEQKNLQDYYDYELEYLTTMNYYGEVGVCQTVKNIYL